MRIAVMCEAGEPIELLGSYKITFSEDDELFVLTCGGNFVYANETFDRVMSRYCMQVIDDCGLTRL